MKELLDQIKEKAFNFANQHPMININQRVVRLTDIEEIFSNQVEPPVKPACVNCKFYKEFNKQDYNENAFTIQWCNLHNYRLSMWKCDKAGCTEFESKSV